MPKRKIEDAASLRKKLKETHPTEQDLSVASVYA